jgi:hypothetical protein
MGLFIHFRPSFRGLILAADFSNGGDHLLKRETWQVFSWFQDFEGKRLAFLKLSPRGGFRRLGGSRLHAATGF